MLGGDSFLLIVFPCSWLLKYLVDRVGGRSSAAPVSSAGVRSSVRPDVWRDVWAAHVSSATPKKKSFDRGGPVWPPWSNVTNDRLRGGSGGTLPPQPKIFWKNPKMKKPQNECDRAAKQAQSRALLKLAEFCPELSENERKMMDRIQTVT